VNARLPGLVLVVVLASPALGRSADEPIDIDLTPRTCVAPCSVRVTVHVPLAESNRTVTITAESSDFYRSSTRQLDADGGPRYHELLLERIPAGSYEIRVTVGRSGEDDASATTTLRVHGDRETMERDQS
jgi:hypothetical protein